jgi:hypothetical protein
LGLLWSGISLIGIPLSRWLPKRILYFIINKNISDLFNDNGDSIKRKLLNSWRRKKTVSNSTSLSNKR